MDTEYTILLNQREKEEIYNLAQEIEASPSEEPELFCIQSKKAGNKIPQRIIQILKSFSLNGNSSGYLLFSGIRIDGDTISDTPKNNTMHLGEKTILAKIQALFNQQLGEMIAYEAEGDGKLFQDMVPSYKFSNSQTSLSSLVELEIHTEQAFSKLKPDFLSLACLRGNKNANTYILHVAEILKHMSPFEQDMLRKPLWEIGVDMSFKMSGEEFIEGNIRGPVPILAKENYLLFDQDLMRGITPEANQLCEKIIKIYYSNRNFHCLQPGEIMILDNRFVVHGRSPFVPTFDGNDRFIIRSFITMDIEKSSYARPNKERTISAIYS